MDRSILMGHLAELARVVAEVSAFGGSDKASEIADRFSRLAKTWGAEDKALVEQMLGLDR